MKRERLTTRDITLLVSVILLAVCCICVGLAVTLVEDIGLLLTAPLRWLDGIFGSADLSLPQALAGTSPAAFALGQGCSFPYTSGSLVSSRGEVRSADLSREQVIEIFEARFEGEVFEVQRGEIELQSGVPVQVSRLAGDSYYLSLVDEQREEGQVTTTSLEGVVEADVFSGSFYLGRTESSVIQGQGIEDSLTATADLRCPLIWVSN
jgi:hypothetical protein